MGTISFLHCTRTLFDTARAQQLNSAVPPRDPTIDLLADWRPYAEPLPVPRDRYDWRYYGTITRDGVTGALAWRAGGFGIGIGKSITELGLWDRIKIQDAVDFDGEPGAEGAPNFQSPPLNDIAVLGEG